MYFHKSIEKTTGDLYSDCFRVLNKQQWRRQGQLLAEQLGLDANNVRSKSCLDGGCGHGALCYQLAVLGAHEVCGVDLHPTPKEDEFLQMPQVRFITDSLLNLPFENNFFDLVVSSGVVHHTVNPEKCISELVRVLKSEGTFVIGLYGRHGLFHYILSLVRLFTVKIPLLRKSIVERIISYVHLDPIWRYQILDYLYVPILRRYCPKELKKLLEKNGLSNVSRVSNISQEKAKAFNQDRTSYSYDHRTWKSKLLFGHGFTVMRGVKK